MSKPVQVGLVVAVAILAITSIALFANYQKTTGDLADTRAVEQEVRQEYSETIDAIAEIQDSLNAISLGDTTVEGKAWNRETGEKLAQPTGREALDRIALLRASIARNRDRITQLEEDLAARGEKVSGLNRLVSNLRKSVAEKEQLVAQLSTENATLKTEVTTLNTTVAMTRDTLRVRDETIVEKQRELATVYYVFGTKDQLKTAGVVETKGGVLGIGKTVKPSAMADASLFTPLNTDTDRVVYIPSEKAQVVSAQPSASYELRVVGETTELHILDPEEFRRIKQVVILMG